MPVRPCLVSSLVIVVACGSSSSSATDGGSDVTLATGLTNNPTSLSTSLSTDDGGSSDTGETGDTPTTSGGADESTTDGPKFDLAPIPDTQPPVECIECALTIASQQSGVFTVQGNNVFATATLEDQVVYALGTMGSGRFIATADSSLPFNEVSDCPILPWLAGSEAAEVSLLWFGWTPSDGPQQWSYPGTNAGVHLPAQYIGNPAQLAADYDLVMYLEASGQFDGGDQPSDAEMQTLVDYVTMYGGGAYISSEFADPNGGAYLNAADLVSVNRVLVPLGVTAQQVSLNWGNVDGNIDFECFPAPAG